MTYKNKLSKLVINLCLVVASVSLCLLFFEVFVRLHFGEKYAKRPVFFNKDPLLGWSTSMNLDHTFYGRDFNLHINTDNFGYRLGKLGKIDYDRYDLIVLLGDSNIFGWGVSSNETISSYLNELVASRSPSFRVLNLGVGGYGTIQSSLRLEQLVSVIDKERIKAIILYHITNDASDNVKFLLFQNGYLVHKEKTTSNSSPFHSLNLLCHFVSRFDTTTENTSFKLPGDEGFTDILHSFPLCWVKKAPKPIIVSRDYIIPRESISFAEDINYKRLYLKNEKLTELQKALLLKSINHMHAVLAGLGIPVFHVVANVRNDSVPAAVKKAVADSKRFGNNVLFKGRLRYKRVYKGPLTNNHSGGHYHPSFNRFIAGVFYNWLLEEEVL